MSAREARHPVRLVFAAVLGLAATGCGGGAPAEEPVDPTPADGVFGRVPPAVGEVPSIVLLTPRDDSLSPATDLPGPVPKPVIDQLGLQFSPRTLLVRVGADVRFTNSETLPHNVTLVTVDGRETLLSEDTPPNESLDFTIPAEGGYRVLCEEHPGMSALIFATNAPVAAFADIDGGFEIGGVPAGEYEISVWSIDPGQRSVGIVVIPPSGAVEYPTGS